VYIELRDTQHEAKIPKMIPFKVSPPSEKKFAPVKKNKHNTHLSISF